MIRKKLTLCILTLALTLTACFTLLQAPKVFAANSPTTGFSDSVEDPAYANYYDGPLYSKWKRYFNCYAVALNRHNVMFSSPEEDHTPKYCYIPGFFCNDITNDETPREYMADKTATNYKESIVDYVKRDLETLKCTNITISDTMPQNISSDTTLICYRYQTTLNADQIAGDYHFMRYNASDNSWTHKPGFDGKVMKYTVQPSNNVDWVYTYYTNTNQTETSTVTYDSAITYITFKETLPHNPFLNATVILNENAFEEMRKRPTGNWCLGKDIDLYDLGKHAPIENFKGGFYGNGYRIVKLKYNGPAIEKIGIFGTLEGSVNGLTISSSEITVTGSVNLSNTINIGTIAAINAQADINGCKVGASKTYAPIIVNSNTMANVGGLCGTNTGTIRSCTVTAFTCICTGNVGGMVGVNQGTISGSIDADTNEYSNTVNGVELHIYSGNVGGVAGINKNTLTKTKVSGSNISCYNGFPTTSASYYPSSHYGRAGGIAGFCERIENSSCEISTCELSSVTVSSANESVDSSHGGRSFAPELGYVCGRGYESDITGCKYNVSCKVTGNNLHTETWGFWPWEKGSWNQAQYVGSRLVGHAL